MLQPLIQLKSIERRLPEQAAQVPANESILLNLDEQKLIVADIYSKHKVLLRHSQLQENRKHTRAVSIATDKVMKDPQANHTIPAEEAQYLLTATPNNMRSYVIYHRFIVKHATFCIPAGLGSSPLLILIGKKGRWAGTKTSLSAGYSVTAQTSAVQIVHSYVQRGNEIDRDMVIVLCSIQVTSMMYGCRTIIDLVNWTTVCVSVEY